MLISLYFYRETYRYHTDIGRAHMIADIIAWVNNKNKEPSDIVSLDLLDEIRKTIHAYLKSKAIPHQLVDRHLVFPDGPQGSDTTYTILLELRHICIVLYQPNNVSSVDIMRNSNLSYY